MFIHYKFKKILCMVLILQFIWDAIFDRQSGKSIRIGNILNISV